MKSFQEKIKTVIEKNTFYFYNEEFEEAYEGYINSLTETLLVLKNRVKTEGSLKKEIFEDLLAKKENGLTSLLALTGLSIESLKRLITFIRVIDDAELNQLVCKKGWIEDSKKNTSDKGLSEWGTNKIQNEIVKNRYFRRGIVNLFFEGSTIPVISKALPLFELKKLSISKLGFNIEALIDTLVRYKEKGSYSGKRENNPERVIEMILDELDIPFETGDLSELVEKAFDTKRTMDFIIPNKRNPIVVIESSYLVTTSSGQGDKSKAEISIDALIKKYHPEAHFIGFVDGIGWYVRKNDLKRMVTAYEDVFTFHDDEVDRFKEFLVKELTNIKEAENEGQQKLSQQNH